MIQQRQWLEDTRTYIAEVHARTRCQELSPDPNGVKIRALRTLGFSGKRREVPSNETVQVGARSCAFLELSSVDRLILHLGKISRITPLQQSEVVPNRPYFNAIHG